MAQIDRLKIKLKITGIDEDDSLLEILEVAKDAILAKRHPYGEYPVDEAGEPVLESRYTSLQLRIAVSLYNKEGAEGQLVHSENGISRTYESSDIPKSLLDEVVPLAGIISPLPVLEEEIV